MHFLGLHKAYADWCQENMPERTDGNANKWAVEDSFVSTLLSIEAPSFDVVRDAYSKAPASHETLALLCARYPFLVPRVYPSGLVAFDPFDMADDDGTEDPRYPGISTYRTEPRDRSLLGDMPEGWARAFGIEMCEDIRTLLLAMRPDAVSDTEQLLTYRVSQVKEKFGTLRWYAGGGLIRNELDSGKDGTHRDGIAYRAIDDIVELYSDVSGRCCVMCGTFDDIRWTRGWVGPMCRGCWESRHENLIARMRKRTSDYDARDVERLSHNTFEGETNPMRPHGQLEGSCECTIYSGDSRETISYYDYVVPEGSPVRKALGIAKPLRIEDIYVRMLAGKGQQDRTDAGEAKGDIMQQE